MSRFIKEIKNIQYNFHFSKYTTYNVKVFKNFKKIYMIFKTIKSIWVP